MPLTDASEEDVLRVAVALERSSEHPLAAAIVGGAALLERGVAADPATDFSAVTAAAWSGVPARRRRGARQRSAARRARHPRDGPVRARCELRARGQTVMFVARDGGLLGLVGVADLQATIRGGDRLAAARGCASMVTGDSRATAVPSRARSASTRSRPRSCRSARREVVRRLR
ncbi:MAG: hypothetical protein U1F09_16275 [Steroidobacteraceae bacterium]